jgi:hypothetical protein
MPRPWIAPPNACVRRWHEPRSLFSRRSTARRLLAELQPDPRERRRGFGRSRSRRPTRDRRAAFVKRRSSGPVREARSGRGVGDEPGHVSREAFRVLKQRAVS